MEPETQGRADDHDNQGGIQSDNDGQDQAGARKVNIGHMAGRVYRKQILAKLEREEAQSTPARNNHDKLMAEARKRVLKHLKALDIKQAAKKDAVRSDIADVVKRYQTNAMKESYENVYGKKVDLLGTF